MSNKQGITAFAVALIVALISVVFIPQPRIVEKAKPSYTDAETLCMSYGGVSEVGSKTRTMRPNGVVEVSLSVCCRDGSYVTRYYSTE